MKFFRKKTATIEDLKRNFGVGLKVTAIVILFEVIMIVAYGILTQMFVDGSDIVARFLNVERAQAIIILLVSSLVLAGYLTFLVVVRIFSPVKDLIRGTEEIMKGNLDLKLDVHTGDELQLLAERFNSMAAALKEGRDELEHKVVERTRAFEESQRKEIERQKELSRLKDEFLFVAAHELRTPITSIGWSLESAKDAKNAKQLRQLVDDAVRSSKSLSILVNDLLDMSRLNVNRIKFDNAPVDLDEVVKEALSEVQPLAEEYGVELIEAVPDNLEKASADQRRLKEVLINLLTNAIKYNKEKGTVWVRARASGDKINLEVEDNGPGIPKEEQKHIFEKFWRSEQVKKIEGSGLGLFITQRLVEGMHGKISFESAVGKGTTFKIELKQAKQK